METERLKWFKVDYNRSVQSYEAIKSVYARYFTRIVKHGFEAPEI